MIVEDVVTTLQPPPVTDDEAARIVAEIGIPPCPAILTAMLREARREEADFKVIGKLIASDLGLSATLLKTVNSPFYGLESRMSSVQQALAFLGLQNVVRLVTGLLLRQAFPVSRNEGVRHLWETSAAIAAGTARLARELRCADRDVAYTFGLFRDCGMLLMSCKYPDYSQLIRTGGFPHEDAFVMAEAGRYVTNHAQVGFHLATSWYLTESLCLAVQHHHDQSFLAATPAGANRGAQVLVALGVLVDAMLHWGGGDTDVSAEGMPGESALACLGIDAADALILAAEVQEACAEQQAGRPE